MKYGELTFGQAEAIVNKLGGMEGVFKLLRDETEVVVKVVEKTAATLLQLITVVMISASKKFVAAKHFVINTSPDAPVSIGYISDNFTEWFLQKVEKARKATELSCYKLLTSSVDGQIITELGGEDKSETTLSEINELLKKQAHGEPGVLLVNGWANIFYVRDDSGVLRAVYAGWDTDDRYWDLSAFPVTDPRRWYARYQVFSRN